MLKQAPCSARPSQNKTTPPIKETPFPSGTPLPAWPLLPTVPDDALQYLQEAVNRGYKNADGLMADPELKNLHSSPKFQQLIAELKSPAVRTQTAP